MLAATRPPSQPLPRWLAGWRCGGQLGLHPLPEVVMHALPSAWLTLTHACLPADTFRFRLRARFPTTGSPPLANMVSNLLCSRACYSVWSAGLGSAKDSQQLL